MEIKITFLIAIFFITSSIYSQAVENLNANSFGGFIGTSSDNLDNNIDDPNPKTINKKKKIKKFTNDNKDWERPNLKLGIKYAPGSYSYKLNSTEANISFKTISHNLGFFLIKKLGNRFDVLIDLNYSMYTFKGLSAQIDPTSLSGKIMNIAFGSNVYMWQGESKKSLAMYYGYSYISNKISESTPLQATSYKKHSVEFGPKFVWPFNYKNIVKIDFMIMPAFMYSETPTNSGNIKRCLVYKPSFEYIYKYTDSFHFSGFYDLTLSKALFDGTGSRSLTNVTVSETHHVFGIKIGYNF